MTLTIKISDKSSTKNYEYLNDSTRLHFNLLINGKIQFNINNNKMFVFCASSESMPLCYKLLTTDRDNSLSFLILHNKKNNGLLPRGSAIITINYEIRPIDLIIITAKLGTK